MQFEHRTRVGRFTVVDTVHATEVLSDGSAGITSEELGRLERRAAITVLSGVEVVEGAELKFARKALCSRQSELAELLGVATETACRWETGKEAFTRQTQLAALQLLEEVDRNGQGALARAAHLPTGDLTLRAKAS